MKPRTDGPRLLLLRLVHRDPSANARLHQTGREAGALRLRLVAVKNRSSAGFPYKDAAGEYDPAVVLDFDYWAAMP